MPKLYLSQFLTGLVFWYGIEKLFMTNIGIDAIGIGIVTAVITAFTAIFDIPVGILADRWSRKGVLVISAAALAVGSAIMGISGGLLVYIVGYLFYGVFIVSTSGTYPALVYDVLHDENRAKQYSKIMGRGYALFLMGTFTANLLSGFLAVKFGYKFNFMISVIPCVLNILLIMTIKEPQFHKNEKKESIFRQLKSSSKVIFKSKLLRGLAVIMSVFAVVEMFKGEFSQLWMMRYFSAPQIVGILWAAYSISWSIGSAIAHRLHKRLKLLILLSVLPILLMSFIDNSFSIILFMIQAVSSAAMLNQIETIVQDKTPSGIRASTLSLLSTIGRLIIIPSGLIVGWIVYSYDIVWALRFITVLALGGCTYWMVFHWDDIRKVSDT